MNILKVTGNTNMENIKSYIKVSFKFFQLILLIEIVILFGLWIKWLIIEN